MAVALPKKVAFRAEHTGSASGDRAQALAQRAVVAHEQTKAVVAALMNQAYVASALDKTIGATAYATLLTATITTTLATGHLVIQATMSGKKLTNDGSAYFRILVDGVVVKGCYEGLKATFPFNCGILVRSAVSEGPHTVVLQWKTDSASLQMNAASAVEEHASLLVQEAA